MVNRANDDIIFVNEDSDNVTFFSDRYLDTGILSVDLNNVILENVNFDEYDPETIIYVRLMAWCNRFKQHKAFQKESSKELLPRACSPTRW